MNTISIFSVKQAKCLRIARAGAFYNGIIVIMFCSFGDLAGNHDAVLLLKGLIGRTHLSAGGGRVNMCLSHCNNVSSRPRKLTDAIPTVQMHPLLY